MSRCNSGDCQLDALLFEDKCHLHIHHSANLPTGHDHTQAAQEIELGNTIFAKLYLAIKDDAEKRRIAKDLKRYVLKWHEAEASRREREARIDGRRIQAEATLDKWNDTDPVREYLFGKFLEGQVEAHRYEFSELKSQGEQDA